MPNKKLEQQLQEARHLIRKHLIRSRHAGVAVVYKCRECGENGGDTASMIAHLETCRAAKLLTELGEDIRFKGKTHDPVAAALECSS